jgi:ubiquitin-like modifier-activating enzyme ATG7
MLPAPWFQVVERYRARGHGFLLEAFNSPAYLEDLTGLTAMKNDADQVDFDMDSDLSGDDF